MNQEYIPVNQKDIFGQKQGFWVESIIEGDRWEYYYKNDTFYGICKTYYGDRQNLSWVGEFENGIDADTWYVFNDQGCISFKCSDFKANKGKRIAYDSGRIVRLPYQAYYTGYYPTGIIKQEGLILYDLEETFFNSIEYGLWKYYDEGGNPVRTKTWEYYDENGNPLNKNLKDE